MSNAKKVKIPQGDIVVHFENNGQSIAMTDKTLWYAISEYIFSAESAKQNSAVFGSPEKETTYETPYDDESPDYIKGTEDGI